MILCLWGAWPVWKFILVTFGVLGFMFYELSGGSDFVPEERPRSAEVETAPQPEISAEEILEIASGRGSDTDITIRDNGSVTLASTSEIELDGVTARLSQPLVSTDDEAPAVSFASLSVSPNGAPVATTDGPRVYDPFAEESQEQVSAFDIRTVDASALNVRSGPSTTDSVVGRLVQFEIVEVLEETGDGWARIRIEGDGIEGWVASRFLSE